MATSESGSYIERYIINQLEELKKENAILKKENEALKIENGTMDDKHVIGLPTLGIRYYLDTHDYYIDRDNIDQYKKALNEKDIKWLQNHHYGIDGSTWNYELHVGNNVARLSLSFYDGEFRANQVSAPYETKEAAEKALLQELSKALDEKYDYYHQQDEKNKETVE